jgi:hypothetical protein
MKNGILAIFVSFTLHCEAATCHAWNIPGSALADSNMFQHDVP